MLVNDARKEVSIIKFARIPAKKCLTSALFVVISQYDLDSLKGTNWGSGGVLHGHSQQEYGYGHPKHILSTLNWGAEEDGGAGSRKFTFFAHKLLC